MNANYGRPIAFFIVSSMKDVSLQLSPVNPVPLAVQCVWAAVFARMACALVHLEDVLSMADV